MKLYPRNVAFCPGCPKKELVLNHMPKTELTPINQADTRKVTIIGTNNNVKKSKNFRLF